MGYIATQPTLAGTHNLRWFVWAIVFLLSTGVLLVTYITYVSVTDETWNSIDVQKATRASARLK